MLALPCCDGDRLPGVASKFAVKWYNWQLKKRPKRSLKWQKAKMTKKAKAKNTKKTKMAKWQLRRGDTSVVAARSMELQRASTSTWSSAIIRIK